MKLQDRVAIVTGGGAGIGRACAARLAAEGARVVVADVDAAAATAAAAALGPGALAWTADVSDPGQVDALVDGTVARLGRLDVLVNNVGFSVDGLIRDLPTATWDRIIAGNLSSVFYGIRAALRHMVPAGRGSIVNMSSAAGAGGAWNMAAYGAAKAAVNHLTRSAAVENARTGVRVNAVAPGGGIATDALMRWLEDQPGGRAAWEARSLTGRLGAPAEIAAAVLFLASDESSLVNGAILPVDGGATARTPTIDPPRGGG
jgi:NAD(P)-dependent dehydrogenase (short-subunit alcohol dehydrogenase family)